MPEGWHIPFTEEEWTKLTDYLKVNVGAKMKSEGIQYWKSPNEGATNESGFQLFQMAIVPGMEFYSIHEYGGWWSFSEFISNSSWIRWLRFDNSDIYSIMNMAFGFSGCLKGENF